MKISVVLPTVILTKELEDLTIQAIKSYREADEIIVSEDGGMFSPKIMALADIYIYNTYNSGFTKNVNRGWKNASGDFIMIANNDTHLIEGSLKDLCIPGKITSPLIVNQSIDGMAGPFWVIPKEVTAERSYLVEELKTYYSDTDYADRTKDIFQKVTNVKIYHEQSRTIKTQGINESKELSRDRQIYELLKSRERVKQL